MADQPVTSNNFLDLGQVTLDDGGAAKSIPVTSNHFLENGLLTLEDVSKSIPVTSNHFLDQGWLAILLGPTIRDQTPFGGIVDTPVTIGFELFTMLPTTVDASTIVVQISIDYGPMELVYDGSAGGFQTGYSGTATPGADTLEDWITFSFSRDTAFDSGVNVRVFVEADDSAAQSMAPPEMFEFDISEGTTLTLVPDTVSNQGGDEVTGTTNLPNGVYEVRVGGSSGAVCYGGPDDENRPYATVAGGSITFWIPPLEQGDYSFHFTDIATLTTYETVHTPLSVIASEMRDKDQSMRQMLPPQYEVGARNAVLKRYPQS